VVLGEGEGEKIRRLLTLGIWLAIGGPSFFFLQFLYRHGIDHVPSVRVDYMDITGAVGSFDKGSNQR
jgi:hypothetical protein